MIRQVLRFICLILLLTVFRTDLDPSTELLSIALGLSFAVASYFSPKLFLFLSAAGIFIFPLFGPGSLAFILVSALIGRNLGGGLSRCEDSVYTGVALLSLVYVFGLAMTALYEVDPYILQTYTNELGLSLALDFLLNSADISSLAVSTAASFLLLPFLYQAIVRGGEGTEVKRSWITYGFCLGALFSGFCLLLQIWDVHWIFSKFRTDFFRSQSRYDASFSDPNALGIMAALAVPFLFYRGIKFKSYARLFCLISAFLMFAAALWSGSRTFWLGLVLISVLSIRRGWLLLLLLALIVIPLGQPDVNEAVRETLKLPSVERVLKTVHWEDGAQMFRSRAMYTSIAVEVLKDHLVFGVGLNRFYFVHHYAAERIGIGLGDWRDNANNYYLQLLCEQGVFGFCFACLAFFLIGRGLLASSSTRFDRSLVLSFAILLLTGPHLFFNEVSAFVAVLLALQAPVPLLSRGILKSTAIVLFSGFLLAWMSIPRSTGFYGLESGNEGEFAWTGKEAHLQLCKGKISELKLRTYQPVSDANPVVLKIRNKARTKEENIEITSSDWIRFPLGDDFFKGDEEPYDVFFEVSRVWKPSEADDRLLGAIVFWPKEACSP